MSKIEKVCDALDQEYGRQTWTRRRNVLDELIYTILSQNTTAANCNQAFRELRRRFLTWDQVRLAPTEQIADAIRVGGLADQKAPRIKRILQEISENKAKLNLEWIADKPNDEALSYLTAFEGVGLKTAACVLMFGLGRPVMPVDTHVHRVATRLGLIEKTTAERAHDLLQSIVPPEKVYSCHINLVTHGRRVCRARNPACYYCVIRNECEYFRTRERNDQRDSRPG